MRRLLSIALAIVLLPTFALAAPARDGSAVTATLAATPNSGVSIACTAGSVLVVRAWSDRTGGGSFTGCTYNGVAMASLGNSDTTTFYSSALYFLGSPASGSHTVSCSVSSGTVGVDAQCYSGASTATPSAGVTQNCLTSTSCTVSGTSPNANAWAIVAGGSGTGAAGSTNVTAIDFTQNSGQNWFGDSNGVTGTTGAYSQTVTAATGIAMIQIFLSPAASAAPSVDAVPWWKWW